MALRFLIALFLASLCAVPARAQWATASMPSNAICDTVLMGPIGGGSPDGAITQGANTFTSAALSVSGFPSGTAGKSIAIANAGSIQAFLAYVQTAVSSSASISGTTMTVGGTIRGTFADNQGVSGSGVTAGTSIVTQLTGTPGGAGTYQVTPSQTVTGPIPISATNGGSGYLTGDQITLAGGTNTVPTVIQVDKATLGGQLPLATITTGDTIPFQFTTSFAVNAPASWPGGPTGLTVSTVIPGVSATTNSTSPSGNTIYTSSTTGVTPGTVGYWAGGPTNGSLVASIVTNTSVTFTASPGSPPTGTIILFSPAVTFSGAVAPVNPVLGLLPLTTNATAPSGTTLYFSSTTGLPTNAAGLIASYPGSPSGLKVVSYIANTSVTFNRDVGTPPTGTVVSFSTDVSVGGPVVLAHIVTPGVYTVAPSNPVSQASTTGAGTGAVWTTTYDLGTYYSTILSVSGNTATLAANASNTVSATSWWYGTDNAAAINKALTYSAGRTVQLAAGNCGHTAMLNLPTNNTGEALQAALAGASITGTRLVALAPMAAQVSRAQTPAFGRGGGVSRMTMEGGALAATNVSALGGDNATFTDLLLKDATYTNLLLGSSADNILTYNVVGLTDPAVFRSTQSSEYNFYSTAEDSQMFGSTFSNASLYDMLDNGGGNKYSLNHVFGVAAATYSYVAQYGVYANGDSQWYGTQCDDTIIACTFIAGSRDIVSDVSAQWAFQTPGFGVEIGPSANYGKVTGVRAAGFDGTSAADVIFFDAYPNPNEVTNDNPGASTSNYATSQIMGAGNTVPVTVTGSSASATLATTNTNGITVPPTGLSMVYVSGSANIPAGDTIIGVTPNVSITLATAPTGSLSGVKLYFSSSCLIVPFSVGINNGFCSDGDGGQLLVSAGVVQPFGISSGGLLNSGGSTAGGVGFASAMVPMKTTVGALPACSSTSKGWKYTVTDASSPTYLGTLTGSSTTTVGALCNGTNWVAD